MQQFNFFSILIVNKVKSVGKPSRLFVLLYLFGDEP